MLSVFDVAKYILDKKSEIPAIKLHKLLYYSQAWHMTWEENILFNLPRNSSWACPEDE